MDTIVIRNVILNSEFLEDAQDEAMVIIITSIL